MNRKNTVLALINVTIWGTLATTAKLLLSSIPNLEMLGVSSIFSVLFC